MTRGAVWAGLWASVDPGAGARRGAGARVGDNDDARRASRPVRRGRAGGLITVGLVVALAAGCTGSAAEPSPSPSPSASTVTPEPSPEPTPAVVAAPVRPAEMSQVDEAGAMAAARYFLELYAYVMATGDLTDWKRFTAQGCEFCDNVVDEVETVYRAGGYFTGGEFTFEDPVHVGFDPTLNVHAIEAPYSLAPSTEYDGTGRAVREYPAGSGYLLVDVILTQGGWLLQTGSPRDEPVQP